MAEDSGIPPRRTSVPVVINFAREVSARIQDNFGSVDNAMMAMVFGAILLASFLVIALLAVYICKHKRKYSRRRSPFDPLASKVMPNYLQHSGYASKQPQMTATVNNGQHRGMDNPMFRRSDMTLNGSSRPDSVSSRRSSSETLSSSPTGNAVTLNPLNPRSGSQRYSKNGMLRMTSAPVLLSPKVSPGSSTGAPPPTPSIHSSGLPDPSRVVNVDPMPNNAVAIRNENGSISGYAQINRGAGGSYVAAANGAIPKHGGSVNSVISSINLSVHSGRESATKSPSEISLQQALRDNILSDSHSRDMTRIHWPRNSIPRRVKKLSWEDEYGTTSRDRDISTLTDPNVSVTPLENQGRSSSEAQIGRAIYF